MRKSSEYNSVTPSNQIGNEPSLAARPHHPSSHRKELGADESVATSTSATAECEALSSKNIPEELRPLWVSLTKLGAPVKALATFEGYLTGNTPMTDAQMEAGCHAMHHFPNSNHKKFGDLGDFVMNSLHDRFTTADDKEKKKISWVAISLFSASYGQSYESKFQKMMDGIGGNYTDKLQEVIGEGVCDTLKMPSTHHSLATMHKVISHDLLDLRRTIRGRSRNAGGLTQGQTDKRNIAYASSIHSIVTSDGRTIEDVLPSESAGPLDTLLMLEEHKATTRLHKAITSLQESPPPTLNAREQEWLRHFFAIAKDGKNPTLNDIATGMGVSASRVLQIKKSAMEKLHVYFSEELGEQTSFRQKVKPKGESTIAEIIAHGTSSQSSVNGRS